MSPAPETTHGFVLRIRPLTDTSLVIHWLTSEHGRLATVAKGARRPSSPFAGKLDLAFECEFTFQRARRGDLHQLREVRLDKPHATLRTDYAYLTQVAYAIALIEQTTETDTPIPEIFELFAGFLNHLPRQIAQARNIYAFELKLLTLEGLEPGGSDSTLPLGALQLIEHLTRESWLNIANLKGQREDVGRVRKFLEAYLTQHWGRVARGRSAALDSSDLQTPMNRG